MTSIANVVSHIGQWTSKVTVTPTLITHVNPAEASQLLQVVTSLSLAAATETNLEKLAKLSRTMRGALASLTIISADNYLATATATQDFPQVTSLLVDATINLEALFVSSNSYRTRLDMAPNVIFAAVFGVVLAAQVGLFAWSRSWYFAVCFICGTGLEFVGYICRSLAVGNELERNLFICQIICLTIAPAFIMAGVYFLLAQMVVIVGPRSSVMKPMWFSYIFIGCDVVSILFQAAGGGISSGERANSGKIGSNVALAGIVFQVATMSVFVCLLFDFFYRSFFYFQLSAPRSAKAFFQILFATKTGREYRRELEASYDPQFAVQRSTSPTLFTYLPLAMVFGWLFIFIRCIYRVVELAEGVDGYLYKTEVFVMVLDALMVFITSAIFVIFYPSVIFGLDHGLLAKAIRKGDVNKGLELFTGTTSISLSDGFESEKVVR